jgi:hypothetical protein
MPQAAQACGNLFVPAVLLVFGLGAMLRAEGRRPADVGDGDEATSARALHRDPRGALASASFAERE